MPFKTIIKRDGSEVPFKIEKIINAIEKAFVADGSNLAHDSRELAEAVVLFLQKANITCPHIEEIQDMVEKVLANLGFAGVGQRYKKFREERRLARGRLFIDDIGPEDYEEVHGLKIVVNSKGRQKNWDPKIIQKKLIDDFQLSNEAAHAIASEVEKKIFGLGFSNVSSELIREFTNHVLREFGFGYLVLKEIRVGVPLRDIEDLFFEGRENNQDNNPEKIRATIATHSLKQFSLQSIFSREVAEAHTNGRMHIHGLGYPGSLVSGICNLRQIALDGLHLHGLHTVSSPAKHVRVLTTHLNTYLACMRPYYYGPISLAYLNIYFAPFLEGLSEEEIKQEAQNLIFITAQNAFMRGGEPLMIDLNVYTYVPNEVLKLMAVGPGGKMDGRTYADFLPLALQFSKALFFYLLEGDANKKPFLYPAITLHYSIQKNIAKSESDILNLANQLNEKFGNVALIAEENETTNFSSLTCLTKSMSCFADKGSEYIRINNLQTISINLPHILLRRGFNFRDVVLQNLENELITILNLAVQAHEEKRTFMLQLSSQVDSPLKELQKIMPDGIPMVDFHSIKCCVSFVGLKEFVAMAINQSIDNNSGLSYACEVLSLFKNCLHEVSMFPEAYEIEYNPELVAAYRLARRDSEKFEDVLPYINKSPASYSLGLSQFHLPGLSKEKINHIRENLLAAIGIKPPYMTVFHSGINDNLKQIL